jgi:hypothetical protein
MADSELNARREPMTSLTEIPRVCFIEDLARVMRLPLARLKAQQKYGYGHFPSLPTIDRRVRYSGEFVRWFLAEHPHQVKRYRVLLETARKQRRQWRRQWYEFGPPHTQPFVAAPHPNELPTLGLEDLAEILRASPGTLRHAVGQPGFALPPQDTKVLAWSEDQVARFLAPPDVRSLEQRVRKYEADRRRPSADRVEGPKPTK